MSLAINESDFSMRENIKKAYSKLLILSLLSTRPYYRNELISSFPEELGFRRNPYEIIMKMVKDGFIIEESRRSEDGRLRRYFIITELGRECLENQLAIYRESSNSIQQFLNQLNIT